MTEPKKQTRGALLTRDSRVKVRCAVCSATADARVRTVTVAFIAAPFEWVQLPPRWTVVLPFTSANKAHCRCPRHGFG